MFRNLVLLLVLCVSTSTVQAQEETSWQLVEVQDLLPVLEPYDQVQTNTLSLSPDGNRLVWATDEALCLYDLESQQGNCQAFPDSFAGVFSYYNLPQWSPDGTYVALSEDWFTSILESDVWVYELASGEFSNLTDDQVEGKYFQLKWGSYNLDYGLTWNPTNNNLYFFRNLYFDRNPYQDEEYKVDLYRTEPNSNTPELVTALTDTLPPMSGYIQPAISPDGTTMAVLTFLGYAPADERNGLWLINLEDGAARQLAGLDELRSVGFPDAQEQTVLVAREVAWAGSAGLLVQLIIPEALTGVNQGVLYVDTLNGEVTPLVDLRDYAKPSELFPDMPPYLRPRSLFIPQEGERAFYSHHNVEQEDQVVISELLLPPSVNSSPQVIGEAPDCGPESLVWMLSMLNPVAENGRALLYNCLLTFERSEIGN